MLTLPEVASNMPRRIPDKVRDPPGQRSLYIPPGTSWNPDNSEPQITVNSLSPVTSQPSKQWRMANVISADHQRFLNNLYLNRELDRFVSFAQWPTCRPMVSPSDLAQNGFFYLGDMYRTQCFSCAGVLTNWTANNNAGREHQIHFPNCQFVLGTESNNVPVPMQPESPQERHRKFPCLFPSHPRMRSEATRLDTFYNRWPMGCIAATPKEIATAGFFFLGERDCVKCWYCNGGLQHWNYDDNPWDEHAKCFPRCQFLLSQKGQHFVHSHLVSFTNFIQPIIARREGAIVDPHERSSNESPENISPPSPGVRGCQAPPSTIARSSMSSSSTASLKREYLGSTNDTLASDGLGPAKATKIEPKVLFINPAESITQTCKDDDDWMPLGKSEAPHKGYDHDEMVEVLLSALEQFEEYLDTGEKPIDLSSIQKKLVSGIYKDPWEFTQDLLKQLSIFNQNCINVCENKIDALMKDLGYCCGKKLQFSSMALQCYGTGQCTGEIPNKAVFYSHQNRYHVCEECFKQKPEEAISVADDHSNPESFIAIPRSEFEKKKNNVGDPEPFVACNVCKKNMHQICVLHMPEIQPEGFTCNNCLLEQRKRNCYAASKLPKNMLSEHIERHVDEYIKRNDATGEAGPVHIRVVDSRHKTVKVQPEMKAQFVYTKDMPEDIPYRAKAIFAFEEIDGVDVCFFGAHVQEYGSDAPKPNRRRVYLSYIDSVHFFHPKHLRTGIYQTILISYFKHCKNLGYEFAHIWVCPPDNSVDYMFYCHPPEQRIPRKKRLQAWYKEMLNRAIREGAIMSFQNIYEQAAKEERWQFACDLPYFEGDAWPDWSEECIKTLKQKDKNGASRVKNDQLTTDLNEIMKKRKDEFLVIRLNTFEDICKMGPTSDPDFTLRCDLMNGREPFLNLARKKHLEFSSLRRTKWSSGVLLYELHTTSQYELTSLCNKCGRNSMNTQYQCTVCNKFNLCISCHEDGHGHEHPMSKVDIHRGYGRLGACPRNSTNKSKEISSQTFLAYLLRVSQCRNPNCNVNELAKHSRNQIKEGPKTCKDCKEFLLVCQHHAKYCQTNKCPIAFCEYFKVEINQEKQQKHLIEQSNHPSHSAHGSVNDTLKSQSTVKGNASQENTLQQMQAVHSSSSQGSISSCAENPAQNNLPNQISNGILQEGASETQMNAAINTIDGPDNDVRQPQDILPNDSHVLDCNFKVACPSTSEAEENLYGQSMENSADYVDTRVNEVSIVQQGTSELCQNLPVENQSSHLCDICVDNTVNQPLQPPNLSPQECSENQLIGNDDGRLTNLSSNALGNCQMDLTMGGDTIDQQVNSPNQQLMNLSLEKAGSRHCDRTASRIAESPPSPSQEDTPNSSALFKTVEGGTKRGGVKLFDQEGFSYTVKRSQSKTGAVSWNCTVRDKKRKSCAAYVIQNGNDYTLYGRHEHDPKCHEFEHAQLSRDLYNAVMESEKPKKEIIKEVRSKYEYKLGTDLPSVQTLERRASRILCKKRSK